MSGVNRLSSAEAEVGVLERCKERERQQTEDHCQRLERFRRRQRSVEHGGGHDGQR